jgi:hypothetical protein
MWQEAMKVRGELLRSRMAPRNVTLLLLATVAARVRADHNDPYRAGHSCGARRRLEEEMDALASEAIGYMQDQFLASIEATDSLERSTAQGPQFIRHDLCRRDVVSQELLLSAPRLRRKKISPESRYVSPSRR